MAEYIEGLVRALGEGNIAAKAAAAHALRDLKGSPVHCMSQCIAEDRRAATCSCGWPTTTRRRRR